MKKVRFFAGLAAGVISAGILSAVPAYASSSTTVYTSIGGTKVTKFDKYLVMENDAVVPEAEFSFTIAPGDAVPLDEDDTIPVLKGVGQPKFLLSTETEEERKNNNEGDADTATVVFSSGDTDDSTVTIAERAVGTNKTVKFRTTTPVDDEKYAQKHIAVSFEDVQFPEPGLYRYVITEETSAEQAAGVTNDTNSIRVLDVLVVDDSSEGTAKLKIENYILHDSEDDVPVKSESDRNIAEIDGKSSGFTNLYDTYDLGFAKMVTGNQASRDKFFKFEVSVENADGAEVTVEGLGTLFDQAPVKSTTTTYEGTDMAAANNRDDNSDREGQQLTADESGRITAVFYLKHGQKVKLLGLPAGATYTITEDAERYTPTITVNEANGGDAAVNTAGDGITDKTTGINGDTTANFTNELKGNIPTGVILAAGVPAVLCIAGLAGAAAIFMNRRKEDSED